VAYSRGMTLIDQNASFKLKFQQAYRKIAGRDS
jgi:hypothetical protein